MNWSKIRKLIAAVLALGGISITVAVNVSVDIDVNEPPIPADSLGWLPNAAELAADTIAESEPLQIAGDDQANAEKNVRFWNYSLIVNDGEHLPTFRQEHGDCVAAGLAQALQYLETIAIVSGELDSNSGQPLEFRPVHVPYIYGTSRVFVGKARISGQGSVGAWAAKAVTEYGVLPADADDVPEYSGTLSKRWGDKPGPPDRFVELAKGFRIRATAHCTSAADVRDAVCNGYPVTIASKFGTKTIDRIDDRNVAKWDGRWSHQMSVIAYDGRPSLSGGPYFYVLNSWGPNAHKPPLQGEPPGGFWVTFATMDRITDSGDCWAFSNFDGFPQRKLDFDVFGDQFIAPGVAQREVAEPVAAQLKQEDLQMTIIGCSLLLLSVLVFIYDKLNRHRCKCAAGLSLCLLLPGVSNAVQPMPLSAFDLTAEPVAVQAGPVDPMPLSAFDLTATEAEQPAPDAGEPLFDPLGIVPEVKETKPATAVDLLLSFYDPNRRVGIRGSVYNHLIYHGVPSDMAAKLDDETGIRLHSVIHWNGNTFDAARRRLLQITTTTGSANRSTTGCRPGQSCYKR